MDWTAIIVAIIAGLSTAIPTTLAVILGFRKLDAKVEGVHKATNSVVTQLVESTAKASHAEGMADERSKLT